MHALSGASRMPARVRVDALAATVELMPLGDSWVCGAVAAPPTHLLLRDQLTVPACCCLAELPLGQLTLCCGYRPTPPCGILPVLVVAGGLRQRRAAAQTEDVLLPDGRASMQARRVPYMQRVWAWLSRAHAEYVCGRHSVTEICLPVHRAMQPVREEDIAQLQVEQATRHLCLAIVRARLYVFAGCVSSQCCDSQTPIMCALATGHLRAWAHRRHCRPTTPRKQRRGGGRLAAIPADVVALGGHMSTYLAYSRPFCHIA